MGIRELKDKYGNVKTWQAFNRAIRAEIPGGNYVLDALGAAGRNRHNSAVDEEIFVNLSKARDAMTAVIAERYELASAMGKEASLVD